MKYLFFLFLFLMSVFNANSQADRLFNSDSTLSVSLYYYSDTIFNDRDKESEYHEAKLELESVTGLQKYDIEVKTRGIFRLKSSNCYFPPLNIKFSKQQIKNTVFEGNPKLKLVYPCDKGNSYQQYILLEYLVYRMYNQVTQYSFRVRLLKLKLIDLSGKEPVYDKYGFFIEPDKTLGERTNAKEMEAKNIHPNQTDYQLINLLSIFQYMVGNTDWSVKALHNIMLFARDSLQKPVAVPYDFDFSGLVNASYATPAESLNLGSVRQRYYNGYHREFDEIMKNVMVFNLKKEQIYELVHSVEGLEEKQIVQTIKYLDQFYEVLDDPKKIEREFISKSRTD